MAEDISEGMESILTSLAVLKVDIELTKILEKILTGKGIKYSVSKEEHKIAWSGMEWDIIKTTKYVFEKPVKLEIQYIPPYTIKINDDELNLMFELELPAKKHLISLTPRLRTPYSADPSMIPYENEDLIAPKEIPVKAIWTTVGIPKVVRPELLMVPGKNYVWFHTFPDEEEISNSEWVVPIAIILLFTGIPIAWWIARQSQTEGKT